MHTNIVFFGTNNYLRQGITFLFQGYKLNECRRYSSVVFFDPLSCVFYDEKHHVDENTLLVVLLENECDKNLFSRKVSHKNIIYAPYRSSCDELFVNIEVQISESNKLSYSSLNNINSNRLTEAESVIFSLAMEGNSLMTIATLLKTTIKNVYYRRSRVMKKMNVSNFAHLHEKYKQYEKFKSLFNSEN